MNRLEAWKMASELIDPLVEKHGLSEYQTAHPFSGRSTFTPVDQHVDHIRTVAEWLLEGEV